MALGRTWAVTLQGVGGQLVEVEADVGRGLPGVSIVGLGDNAVLQARHRVRAAVSNSNLAWPPGKVVLSLSPAAVPKRGSGLDLALAVGVLTVSGELPAVAFDGTLLLGELALDGRVRPVRGVLPAVLAARAAGLDRAIVPEANLAEARLVHGIDSAGVDSLARLALWSRGSGDLICRAPEVDRADGDDLTDLGEVIGQDDCRRAVEVAAAGDHALLLRGAPGVVAYVSTWCWQASSLIGSLWRRPLHRGIASVSVVVCAPRPLCTASPIVRVVHIARVDVERLLGFEDVSIEVDPQLQLIAGPNNAGKSSLLRVLETFFSNPTGEDLQRLKPLHDYYVHGGPRMMSNIVVHFGGLTDADREIFGDAVLRNDTFWIKLACSRTGKISYEASRKSTRPRELYEQALQSFSFVKIPSVRVSEADHGESDQSLVRLYETLEGVLVRSGGSRKTQLQKDFEDAIQPVEDLVHKVLSASVAAVATELPFRERDLGINLPDSRHALRGMLQQAVITSRDDVEVPIAERGTGFQSAMVLGILRYVASHSQQAGGNVVFAIEEPEAFLHPQTQRAMAKILREISEGAQLLVTTHSPVLVDSFSVRRIVRLPLCSGGTKYTARRQHMTDAEEGRLTRYCDATNSELVFANSVVLVEGYGDKLLIDYLLGRASGGVGGHYAMGIAVIEASGIDTIRHLVKLAQFFGVRAYILTDKDGVHKAGPKGPRALLEILKARDPAPSQADLDALRGLADRQVATRTDAIEHQAQLNEMLTPWDAFVLASDLEGLLLDTLGQKKLSEALGPAREREIDQATADRFAAGTNGKDELAAWLGSKGWNSTGKKSSKAKPHLPSALLREHLAERKTVPQAVKPLDDWLRAIVQDHERSPL